MSYKVHVRVVRGIMPRSGGLNNKLMIYVDNLAHKGTGWGRNTTFSLPDGRHSIAVVDGSGRRPNNSITVDSAGGSPVDLIAYLDAQTGQLNVINKADQNAVADMQYKASLSGGSAAKSNVAHQGAVGTIFFVGIVTLILGIVAQFTDVLDMLALNSVVLICLGIVFITLGFFVQRKSLIALILAILIYAWDLVGIVLTLTLGHIAILGNLVIHIVFLISMIRGIGAIKKLKSEDAAQADSRPPTQGMPQTLAANSGTGTPIAQHTGMEQVCPFCGRQYLPEEKYCSGCGTPRNG